MPLFRSRLIADRYELLAPLGEGTFAVTWLAEDRVRGFDVAIKILREQYRNHPTFAPRFELEARSAGVVSHPNVVTIFESGRDGDVRYIVMQYVAGPTLKQYVRDSGGKLSTDEAMGLAGQILDGLAAIHDAGIIHRDVKPQNVLLSSSRQAKLADFGIARSPGESDLTGSGIALGTAAYMAPEQASGQEVSPATDLYSLGVILYEMLTGHLPFHADNPIKVMYQHVNEPPPSARDLNSGVPPALDRVILRSLAKSPAERFPDARSMHAALLGVASDDASVTFVSPAAPTVSSTDEYAAVSHDPADEPIPSVPDEPVPPPEEDALERVAVATTYVARQPTRSRVALALRAITRAAASAPARVRAIVGVFAPSHPRRRVAGLVVLVGVIGVLTLSSFVGGSGDGSGADLTAFERTYARTDRPVADAQVERTWMWGPAPRTGLIREPYAESPDGERLVQYFDKARMELTHPGADPTDTWYVTNGLLVAELATGRMQLGDDSFEQREPADINVAGDADDPTGPTYRTIAGLMSQPPADDGALIVERIDRDGQVTTDWTTEAHEVYAAQRVSVPGSDHQIADVFWEFMHSSGLISDGETSVTDALFADPFYATGYPITEAYWATVKIAGTYQDVLIQCFERRCLTYTPLSDPTWRVEAGNVGLHYYRWRYGEDPPGE